MQKYILSCLLGIILPFQSLASDNREIMRGVYEKADTSVQISVVTEDPNYLEKFKNTYPQNCPECTGQLVGMCMSTDREIVNCCLIISMICCVPTFVTYVLPPTNPLWHIFWCAGSGTTSSIPVSKCLGDSIYNYAERSERTQVTERADFARLCSLEDPLSSQSCCNRVGDCCCVPLKKYFTTIANTTWRWGVRDVAKTLCGANIADTKREV